MGRRQQGVTLYTGVLWLIGTVFIVQLWLGTAALEALLAGHLGVVVPAAAVSIMLALANVGLMWLVDRTDSQIRRDVGPPE